MSKLVKVSCGSFHTVVVSADGDAFSWGSNKFGQCGVKGQNNCWHDPQKVNFEMYCDPHLRLVNAGGSHTGFIDDVGRLFMCGKNDNGQLGLDSFIHEPLPVIVDRIKGQIKEVACGDEHSLVLDR